MLIEHLDTTVPVHRHFDPYRNQIRRKLVDDGLLRLDRPSFPNYTSLTDLGREKLCALLADYADALARAALRREDKDFAADLDSLTDWQDLPAHPPDS